MPVLQSYQECDHHLEVKQFGGAKLANQYLLTQNGVPLQFSEVAPCCSWTHSELKLKRRWRTSWTNLHKWTECARAWSQPWILTTSNKSTISSLQMDQDKVLAIIFISLPKNIKELHSFLSMIQFYRNMWARKVICLPLSVTTLVREFSQNIVTTGTKNAPWHWDEVHQKEFDNIKATIAIDSY